MRFLPQKVNGDDSKLVQLVNDMLAQLRASKPRGSPTINVSETADGTIIEAIARGSSQPGVQIKALHFTRSFGDYFLTQEGIPVAKGFKLRNSITQATIYGTVVSYTYPHNIGGDPLAYVYRLASITGLATKENQGVVPQFLPNDLIFAVQFGDTKVASVSNDASQPAGTPITWLDLNVDGRVWTRFSNPAA